MKILVDENIPATTVTELREPGLGREDGECLFPGQKNAGILPTEMRRDFQTPLNYIAVNNSGQM
ncbi:MAG: hypothetical protein JRH15_12905 [Deltaproteobacteria bacterium]|nr:hypothetical protein [Deltaproteobacteria bacterium]